MVAVASVRDNTERSALSVVVNTDMLWEAPGDVASLKERTVLQSHCVSSERGKTKKKVTERPEKWEGDAHNVLPGKASMEP